MLCINSLMQNLNLSDSDQINFLIIGIGNMSIRTSALEATSINQFLRRMHKITMVCSDSGKQQSPFNKQKKNKIKGANDLSTKGGDSSKTVKNLHCVYCKAKGNLRADCFKLKRKEQNQAVSSPTAAVTAVETTRSAIVAAVDAVSTQPVTTISAVSCVSLKELVMVNTRTQVKVKVTSLNNVPCNLTALIDSGNYFSVYFSGFIDILITIIIKLSAGSYMAINKLLSVAGTILYLFVLNLYPM